MSMPISYESSALLKCTVGFRYVRYYIGDPENESKPESATTEPEENRPKGNPSPKDAEASLGGSTNGPGTEFADRDSASGGSAVNDGPLLLPDGSPAYDSNGRLRSMF